MQRDPNSVCVCVCLIYDQTSDGHNSILKYRNKLRFKPLQANLKHTHVVYEVAEKMTARPSVVL